MLGRYAYAVAVSSSYHLVGLMMPFPRAHQLRRPVSCTVPYHALVLLSVGAIQIHNVWSISS